MAGCDRNCCLGLSISSSALVMSICDQNIKTGSFTYEKKNVHQKWDFLGVIIICKCHIILYIFSLMILCIKDHEDTCIKDNKETLNTWYIQQTLQITYFFFIFCIFNHIIFSDIYYLLANEVAKRYSNTTVRPSFRSIFVNTLESTSFNGF